MEDSECQVQKMEHVLMTWRPLTALCKCRQALSGQTAESDRNRAPSRHARAGRCDPLRAHAPPPARPRPHRARAGAGLDGPRTASPVSESVSGATAAAFTSYTQLQGEKRVHRRLPLGPTRLYSEPVTGGMVIGWRTALEDPKVPPTPRPAR